MINRTTTPAFRNAMLFFASLLILLTASWSMSFAEEKGNPHQVQRDSKTNWQLWRGQQQRGHAHPEQSPPTNLDKTQNLKWSVPIPGKGHGSPIVYEGRIYIASADDKTQEQMLLCYDQSTGKQIWKTAVHQGKFPTKMNRKASHASSTPACDGERVYINFVNDGAAHLSALTLDGKIVWQTRLTDYVIHQGYGSSPTFFEHLVIVAADNKKAGAICGLDRKTGEIVWKHKRPKFPNYVSPIIYHLNGQYQLLLSGCELVTSLNPLTGKVIWEVEGSTTECVTSAVTDGKHVFTSGGYPNNHVAAVTVDGKGETAWRNLNRVYVPSMLVKDGYLYATMDAGVAVCYKSDTGKVMWKGRIGGTFSTSLVLVGDKLYTANESGELIVFAADPDEFKLIAKNKIANQIYATPTIVSSQIFQRVVVYKGEQRMEQLRCYAHPQTAEK